MKTYSMNKTLLMIMMILFVGYARANDPTEIHEKKFPNGCVPKDYKFKFNTLTLLPPSKGGVHDIYFIHNIYPRAVNLFQMRTDDEPYILNQNDKILSNQWGVFAVSENEVRFLCTADSPHSLSGDIIACEDALQVCEYPNVEFSITNHGEYWSVSSNPSLQDAVREVIRQGVLLRW